MPHGAEPDWNEIIMDVLPILAEIEPRGAAAFYLLHVDGMTEQEVAEQFGVTDRTVRRWLRGNNEKRPPLWGALDYLDDLLVVFGQAHRCDGRTTMNRAFRYALQHNNPWNEPFPAALLEIFWQAQDQNVLPQLLAHLARAERRNTYYQVISALLKHYHTDQLCRLCNALGFF